MERILTELESVIESLSNPADLDGEELSFLNEKWNLAISHLNEVIALNPHILGASEPDLRPRLEQVIASLPEVQELLLSHKSEVAAQLFLENRRIKAIKQGGYGAFTGRHRLIHHRA